MCVDVLKKRNTYSRYTYRGADNSLARPTSRWSLFDGENISFGASLLIYINGTNIPPIMIINRISKSSVAVACFLPGRAKDLSAPLYKSCITAHDVTEILGKLCR